MEQGVITPVLIEKEEISSLHFPKEEVLKNIDDIKVRSLSLQQAIKLGNNQKRKVKITFEDDNGVKKVETTIWAITDKNILLKRGVLVPICRIHQVSPY